MPRKYSPAEKTTALEILRQTGDVSLTVLKTGIGQSTLYKWRKALWLMESVEESPPFQTFHFEDDLSALTYLRSQLLDELLSSSQNWRGSVALMSPYQRSQIAIMLLDRLMKLDEHLKPYRPQPTIIHKVTDSEGQEPDGDEPDITESTPGAGQDSQE